MMSFMNQELELSNNVESLGESGMMLLNEV